MRDLLVMFRTALAVVTVICLAAQSGWATTWYLSPTGSDSSGDGSWGNPWYELEVAVAKPQIQDGDEVGIA